jgi:L-ascorbate metabolism protein UlaG (beta-lactamase superfamily)
MEIRFLGHATFELSEGDARVLIDPFLAPHNPAASVTADEVDPTHILLTHGHADHVADAVAVAKRTGAHCVAMVELANWLADQGIENVSDPNIGGTVEFDWGWVKLVQAFHSSTTPDGKATHPPAGLVVYMNGKTVYHLGDTGLFGDLALIAERTPVDVALIPIGGRRAGVQGQRREADQLARGRARARPELRHERRRYGVGCSTGRPAAKSLIFAAVSAVSGRPCPKHTTRASSAASLRMLRHDSERSHVNRAGISPI